MATKSQQLPTYRPVPKLLKELRERANLTQRGLGKLLKKPQSWIYNCETANRRVDASEFALWARACGVKPMVAMSRLDKLI